MTADADYYDARDWIALNEKNSEMKATGGYLSQNDRDRWYKIDAKYDLNPS